MFINIFLIKGVFIRRDVKKKEGNYKCVCGVGWNKSRMFHKLPSGGGGIYSSPQSKHMNINMKREIIIME